MTAPKPTARRLLLFIAGDGVNSRLARANADLLCNAHTAGIEVEVVDVFEDFRMAQTHGVLVTPCLVTAESPRVVIVGTLNDLSRVRRVLGLKDGTHA